ncbi:MAG: hypothetical protein ITD27_06615 [Nitrosospira sp.]|nr:hypothetical protein [Nitrosospira sp.]
MCVDAFVFGGLVELQRALVSFCLLPRGIFTHSRITVEAGWLSAADTVR